MPASQHQNPKSDIEIAQAAKKRPIMELANEKLGISHRSEYVDFALKVGILGTANSPTRS